MISASNSTRGLVALAELFPVTVVLCYEHTCSRHRPGGGYWSAAAQRKVIVADGAHVDATDHRELLSCMLGGYGPEGAPKPHKFGATLSHWRAVELAAERRADKVLIVEADAVDTPAAAEAAAHQSAAWKSALEQMVQSAWTVLRLTSNVHPPQVPFQRGCNCSSVVQLGQAGLLPAATMTEITSDLKRVSPVLCHVPRGASRGGTPVPFDRPSWAVGNQLDDREKEAPVKPIDPDDECKATNSAAYAVHSRAFTRYRKALAMVRAMCAHPHASMASWKADRFEVIDKWLPTFFDNTYVMPPVVVQTSSAIRQARDEPPGALMYSSAQMSLRYATQQGRWVPVVA